MTQVFFIYDKTFYYNTMQEILHHQPAAYLGNIDVLFNGKHLFHTHSPRILELLAVLSPL